MAARRRSIGLKFCGLAVWILIPFCGGSAKQQHRPLTNQDIVTMVRGGLEESIVLLTIDLEASEFDISPAQLIALKDQGISETVIRAMLDAETRKRSSARGSPSMPEPAAPRESPTGFPIFPVDFFAEQWTSPDAKAPRVSEGRLFVGEGRLRFELTSSSTVTIVDPLTFTGYLLVAGKPAEVVHRFEGVRGVVNQDGLSRYLLPVNPQNPCAYWVSVECKSLGTETQEGRSVTKWELTHYLGDESWTSYIWVDLRLHIVSKRQYQGGMVVLLKIVEGSEPSALFQVP
jgi:hypothetical protein